MHVFNKTWVRTQINEVLNIHLAIYFSWAVVSLPDFFYATAVGYIFLITTSEQKLKMG